MVTDKECKQSVFISLFFSLEKGLKPTNVLLKKLNPVTHECSSDEPQTSTELQI